MHIPHPYSHFGKLKLQGECVYPSFPSHPTLFHQTAGGRQRTLSPAPAKRSQSFFRWGGPARALGAGWGNCRTDLVANG